MRTRRIGWLGTVALTVSAVAGCDSTTEPEPSSFDAEAALEDYEALGELLGTMGWGGFDAMGEVVTQATGAMDPTLPADLLPVSAPAGPADPSAFASALLGLLDRSHLLPSPSRAPLISDLHRGSTFVWSPADGRYVLDPDRPGAPATGVRFVLYEGLQDGTPDVEAEVGRADLIDLGDGSAEDVVLRLEVVVGGLTRLDYRTSVDDLGDGAAISVDGFLQDEVDRLDFDLEISGSESGGASAVDLGFEMRMDSRDFSIDGRVSGTSGDGEAGDVDVTVRHGARSLRVDVDGTDSALQGTIYLDGDVFATVEGNPDDPVFTGAGGEALTYHEVAVLLRILAVVADTLHLFTELVAPVAHLILLGVIL